jgi:hypothetical protein
MAQSGISTENDDAGRHSGAQTALASVAAIGSVIAASSCCLPILPFVAAAGFAGGSAFLSAARPYLLGISVLFIAYGFFQARRAKQCLRKPGTVALLLLWISTAFLAISIFLPQMIANAAADLLSQTPPR